MDTMDGMDKNGLLNGQWTMDNGRWTMDDGRWTEIMYLSGLIPTSPIRSTDPSEIATDQTAILRAIPSVKAATLQIFRVFRAFRGQKNGLWAVARPKPVRDFRC